MISILSKNELHTALQQLPEWQIKNEQLSRQFVFKNFIEAFGFMSQAALIAERDNHHPEWSNVYKTVDVALITHEVKGITQRDIQLATEMDNIATSFFQK